MEKENAYYGRPRSVAANSNILKIPWNIFTDVIDPGTVETEAALCTVHCALCTVHRNEYFKLPTLFIKFLI